MEPFESDVLPAGKNLNAASPDDSVDHVNAFLKKYSIFWGRAAGQALISAPSSFQFII